MSRTYVIKIIRVDGTEEDVNRKLTLQELQKAVGGLIERIPCRLKNRFLLADEEGLLKKKEINPAATKLVADGVWMEGGLRGVALLCNGK